MKKNNNVLLTDYLHQNKDRLSFSEWAQSNCNSIESHLIMAGIDFVNEQSHQLKAPVLNLTLDNRWHYIDKPSKKQSYKAQITIDSDGIPWLNLTYYTFRHGGYSERFDSKAVLKALWQEARGAQFTSPLKPVNKPSSKPLTPPLPVANSLEWIGREQAAWTAMSATGTSHYLCRKGLGTGTIPGIRIANNHVAVAIIDTDNQFLGLQRIFNDGQKRFSKGLSKKGHFAVIGASCLPGKISTVHVCEGVATAASIHQAIGEPVFSALDAFNLLPVCKALKKRYPKTRIIIWADNDWQKADKPTKFGRVLGNTGRIQANRTAFKLRGSLVCTPDFTTFDSALAQEATDFNDLHRLGGLSCLQAVVAHKPDIHLGLWHEQQRLQQHAHGVLTPTQFKEGVKQGYNQRYLPHSIFDREGVHLVRSAIGTGKTAIVEHWVKSHPSQSILFTTHLISLVESAAERLGLTSYNACDNFDLQIERRLAVCLNSLGKLTAEGALRDYDVVVIDEIEQVLARLTSSIEQKPLVFSVLNHVMARAKTLICLDAHLSEATVQMVQRFCPSKPVTVHYNSFEPGQGRAIAFHDSPESVQMAALKALEQQKNVYLAFNSKKEAYKTFSIFSTAFPEKKGLYISSDNAGDAENKAFFNDVNAVSKRYAYIVCTPSVSTGVSIDNGHFDFVGGVFSAHINTANDCMQALGRVRKHPILEVFCDKRQASRSLTPEVIASKWLKTHEHDLSLMNLGQQGERILLNPDYEQLTVLVTQARSRSFNDFYEQFSLLALHEGLRLGYAEGALDTETRQQLRHFKQACMEHDTALMSRESLPLSAAQLVALAQKPRKTMRESRQYKKQQLIEFYNISENDEDALSALAALDNEGRFKKQVLALELAFGDASLAHKRFSAQLEESTQFAADLTHYASLQELYKKVLVTVRASNQNPTLNGYHYSKESLLTSGFIDWIEARRPILQGLITLPSPQSLQRDPVRFLSLLLARMGLKQKRVGRTEHGMYQLDRARLDFLNALIARRANGVAGLYTPLDTASCRLKEPSTTEFFVNAFKKIKRFFTPDVVDNRLPA